MQHLKRIGRLARCSAVMTITLLQLVLVMTAQAEAPWPDPERFRAAIEAFESEDREAPPPSGAIVGTGSSSMRFWSVGDRFASDLSPLTVINRGFGGSVIHDGSTFFYHHLQNFSTIYHYLKFSAAWGIYLTLFLRFCQNLVKNASNSHCFRLVSFGVTSLGKRDFDPPQY